MAKIENLMSVADYLAECYHKGQYNGLGDKLSDLAYSIAECHGLTYREGKEIMEREMLARGVNCH